MTFNFSFLTSCTNSFNLLDYCSFIVGLLTFLATLVTTCIAYAAFHYTKREYELFREKERAETLSAFNERYSADDNIAAVVTYLSKIDEYPNPEPSTFQKEMFLRFFEELQYAIEKRTISEELVYDMFAYYALKAYDMKYKFYNEEDEKYWLRFCAFVNRMKKFKN